MRGQRPPVRIFARGKERNPLAGAKRRRMRGPAGGRAPSGGRHAGRRFRFAFSQEERNGTRLPARSGGGCGAMRREAPSGGRHAGTTPPGSHFRKRKGTEPACRRRCRQSSSKRGGRRSGVALHGKGRARSDRMETGRCLKPAIRPEIAGDRACGTEVGRISRAPFQQSVGWKSAPRRKTDAAQAGGEGAVRFNRRSPPARRRPTAGGAAAPGPRRN